jgi:DNA-binding PadR family transcriptional regulator
MALKHAVLGLLIERPSYGYEIGQRLTERCPASGWRLTGIYTAIDALERDCYVRAAGERTLGKRGSMRRRYEATPPGHVFFDTWMVEPSQLVSERQELDLKLEIASPEQLPILIGQCRDQELECMNELQDLLAQAASSAGALSTWPEMSAVLQRNRRIKMLQCRIEVLQEARSMIQAGLSASDPRARRSLRG